LREVADDGRRPGQAHAGAVGVKGAATGVAAAAARPAGEPAARDLAAPGDGDTFRDLKRAGGRERATDGSDGAAVGVTAVAAVAATCFGHAGTAPETTASAEGRSFAPAQLSPAQRGPPPNDPAAAPPPPRYRRWRWRFRFPQSRQTRQSRPRPC